MLKTKKNGIAKSRSSNSLKNIIISFGLLLFGYVLTFVYRRIFVEVFDVQYLGVVGLFSSVISMLSLAELGFGSAIMYALYKPLAENDTVRVAHIIRYFKKVYIIVAGVVLVIGLCMIPALPYLIKGGTPDIHPNLTIIYLFYLGGTVLSYFNGYKTTLLLADQKEYITKIVATIIRTASQVLIIVLLIFIKSFYVVMILENLVLVVQNIIFTIIVNRKYPYLRSTKGTLEYDGRKAIIKYTSSLFAHKLGGIILSASDTLIISGMLGSIIMGYYSNYMLLTVSLNGVIGILFGGVLASLGQYSVLRTKEEQYAMFRVFNLIGSWVAIFFSLGVYFVSTNFIVVWLGGTEFSLSNLTVLCISLSFYFENMSRANSAFVQSTGVFTKTPILSIAYAVVNVIASVILVKYMGLAGVLLGTVIARLSTGGIEAWMLFKCGFDVKAIKYYKQTSMYILVSVVSAALCYAMSRVQIDNKYLRLIYSIAYVCIIPNALFLGLFCKTKEFDRILVLLKLKKQKPSATTEVVDTTRIEKLLDELEDLDNGGVEQLLRVNKEVVESHDNEAKDNQDKSDDKTANGEG